MSGVTTRLAIFNEIGQICGVVRITEDGLALLLPGGKPDLGESLVEAVRRETLEEIGVKISLESIDFVGEWIVNSQGVFLFRVDSGKWFGVPVIREKEKFEPDVVWFKPENYIEFCSNRGYVEGWGLRDLLPKLSCKK